MHLLAIAGTNVAHSTNLKLLQYMQKHFSDQAIIDLVDLQPLPAFYQYDRGETIPQAVESLADQIEASDGVIISTPEYDHSIPAVLKNMLEWLSSVRRPFVDKPVMITGASYGVLGSNRAQAQLRQILDSPELRARIMPSSEFLLGHSLQAFDDDGELADPLKVKQLDQCFEEFQLFVQVTAYLNRERAKRFGERTDCLDTSWQSFLKEVRHD